LNVAGLGVALAMSDRLDEVPSDASPAEMRSAIDDARELSEPPL